MKLIFNRLPFFIFAAFLAMMPHEAQAKERHNKKNPAKIKRKKENNKKQDSVNLRENGHSAFGVDTGLPYGLRFRYRYMFNRSFGVQAFFAPALPYSQETTVDGQKLSGSGDLAGGDDLYEIYTNEKTFTVDLEYGPAYGVEAVIFPFSSNFYFVSGISYRRIYGYAKAGIPLHFCIYNGDTCSEESGNEFFEGFEIDFEGEIESFTYNATLEMGYQWNVTKNWDIDLSFLGIFYPFKQRRETVVVSQVDSQDDVINAAINSSLEEIISAEEQETESELDKVLEKYDSQILPVVTLSVSYRF